MPQGLQMQKLLICLVSIASLHLVGCSFGQERDNTARRSLLERIPIVYRPDIQQGNTLDQETINQLKPGMTKTQVRFLLGTPMLVDVFHQDRWDYVYTMTEGWGDMEEKRVTLFFDDDRLVRLEGNYRPEPGAPDVFVNRETVVSVPNYEGGDQGIISRTLRAVGDVWDAEESPEPAVKEAPADAPGPAADATEDASGIPGH